MTTEQKIHAAYIEAVEIQTTVCHYTSFKAGYLALLNELELGDWARDSDNAPLYALPEGVEKP